MANPKTYRDRRTAPEMEDEGAYNHEDVSRMTNAHPEQEYEDMRRLPTRQTFDFRTGEITLSHDPMSARVRTQVLDSIGQRAGSMTFASQLDRSRGVGSDKAGDARGYNTPADNRGSGQPRRKAGAR
jgi:hypothetical protein